MSWLWQVTVCTKSAKSDKQYVWEGAAETSSYTVGEETDSGKLIPRGTSVILHLKVCSNLPGSCINIAFCVR